MNLIIIISFHSSSYSFFTSIFILISDYFHISLGFVIFLVFSKDSYWAVWKSLCRHQTESGIQLCFVWINWVIKATCATVKLFTWHNLCLTRWIVFNVANELQILKTTKIISSLLIRTQPSCQHSPNPYIVMCFLH